jgi:hypothetical protein
MRSVTNGWFVIAAAVLLLPGCGGSPETQPAAAPAGEKAEVLSAWIKVYEAAIEGSEVTRTAMGFVEHRRLEGESQGSYFVYSVKDMKTPVGFFLPSGQTYRYVSEPNSKEVVSKNLGPLEPQDAVRILLRMKAAIEFSKELKL